MTRKRLTLATAIALWLLAVAFLLSPQLPSVIAQAIGQVVAGCVGTTQNCRALNIDSSGDVVVSSASGTTSVVRTTPKMLGYTTDFDSGITVLASGSTSTVTATTTLVQSLSCNNSTGAAVNIQIMDGSGHYYVGPNFSLPGAANLQLNWETGLIWNAGITASANSASSINCQFAGKQ